MSRSAADRASSPDCNCAEHLDRLNVLREPRSRATCAICPPRQPGAYWSGMSPPGDEPSTPLIEVAARVRVDGKVEFAA